MQFIPIDEQKTDIVFKFLKEAALWLKARHIDYWQNWLDPPAGHKNWILKGLKNRQFYFIYENDILIGMFRLQYEDKIFWGERTDKAGYLHSFTINRELRGQGLGFKVLKQIEQNLKNQNCRFFRLDCGINDIPLCDYYKKFGFKEVGSIIVHEEGLMLLEKTLTTADKNNRLTVLE